MLAVCETTSVAAMRRPVMTFPADEAAFLHSPELHYLQKTAYIATVSADGQPDVVAVGYEFDGTYLYIGGAQILTSRKYRNVLAGNTKVAFFLERKAAEEPWTPSWLRVYGTADLVDREGPFAVADQHRYIRITPEISWSFNLGGRNLSPNVSHDEGLEFFRGPGAVRRTVHKVAEPAENS